MGKTMKWSFVRSKCIPVQMQPTKAELLAKGGKNVFVSADDERRATEQLISALQPTILGHVSM